MSDHHTHPDQQRADRLNAFADAVVDGHAPPASDEIEAVMLRAWRALGDRSLTTTPLPSELRNHIREELMTSTTATFDHIGRTPLPPDGEAPASLAIPALPPARGWQAIAGFALMIAMLAALVALTWQATTNDGAGEPTPTSVAAQGLYDPEDPSTFPMMPEACVPNGQIGDANVANRSINDWVAPEYAPAKAVPTETGLAIQQMYMNYLRCEWEAFNQQFPPGSTPPAGEGTPIPPLERSPDMLTYLSDRLRFDHMYGSLSPEQQADLDAYRCLPRIDTILATFPLPVNQPMDYAIWSLLPHIDEIDELALVFSPSDVYLLPDGRYGAIVGSVSTAALDDPNAVISDDLLAFVAFVEEDGRYYIDEMFTVFAPDMDFRLSEGRNGTILMNCD